MSARPRPWGSSAPDRPEPALSKHQRDAAEDEEELAASIRHAAEMGRLGRTGWREMDPGNNQAAARERELRRGGADPEPPVYGLG